MARVHLQTYLEQTGPVSVFYANPRKQEKTMEGTDFNEYFVSGRRGIVFHFSSPCPVLSNQPEVGTLDRAEQKEMDKEG